MIISWVKNLETEEQKQNFERQFHNAADVLERLADIYRDRLTQIEIAEKDFSPGWDYKIANLIGRREEIKGLLKLIDLDQ